MRRIMYVLLMLVCVGGQSFAEEQATAPRVDRAEQVAQLPRNTTRVVVHTLHTPRDATLTALTVRCPDLQELTLVAGHHPTVEEWAQLATLRQLRQLTFLSQGAPSTQTYAQIAQLPALRTLDLTVD